ncbi:MAG: TRAP transporter large permease subunit [Gammaproteobacteria bacterium]|nr:TRAP transporter large permease subunit [Gammaproteobacteria bacterium]MDH3407443.1 TRAP transporter large permease subunit [Gammaproteobacteria bacterium]
MSNPVIALVMLGILVSAIMIGFPVAFTLMALGVGFGYYAYFQPNQAFFDNRVFDLLTQNTFTVINNDALVSIPLFLLMGYLVERANILDNLFLSLQLALKRLPGSLAVATLATCALFATATGIVGAVVTLMGLLAYPQMMKAGYDPKIAAGVVCAGGCLGILIPPSIMLIVYAAQASISVVKLYAAALLPGFLLAGMYIAYVVILSIVKPGVAPPLPKEKSNFSRRQVVAMLFKSFVPLAALILSVLGAIMFGLATPTEAAAVGAFGGFVLAMLYRSLTWPRFKESVYLTARTSAMVCWLFVGSATFASVFAYLGGEGIIKEYVLGMDLNPITFLLMSQFIIFLLGWPLEWTEIIIIFVPIFLPLLPHFQIDPILFGVLVALNLQTAFLSPPMAMSAYYLKGVAPRSLQLTQIFRGCMPFLYIVLLSMVLVYVWPQIALWLPNVIYGK